MEPKKIQTSTVRSPVSSDQSRIDERELTIRKSLVEMAVSCPQSQISEAQARLKAEIFCDDLAEFAPGIIAEAFKTYRRNPDNVFFPTPGQIYGLCRDLRPKNQGPFYRAPPEDEAFYGGMRREVDAWWDKKKAQRT